MREPNRLLIMGRTGCGKTTLLKHILASHSHVIIHDPKSDFRHDGTVTKIDTQRPTWKKELLQAMQVNWQTGFRIALMPGKDGNPSRDVIEVCQLLFKVQERYHAAHPSQRHLMPQICLAMDEMHLSFGPQSERKEEFEPIRDMIRMGRDYGVFMIGVTQRPAALSTDYRGNCSEAYIFAIGLMDQAGRDTCTRMLPPDYRRRYTEMENFQYLHVDQVKVTPGETRPQH